LSVAVGCVQPNYNISIGINEYAYLSDDTNFRLFKCISTTINPSKNAMSPLALTVAAILP